MMVVLPNGALVCSFGWRPFKAIPSQVDGGAYVGALRDYEERYRSLVGIEDPSAAAGDYVMVSVDKGHTWSRPVKVADPLTVGYTLLAPTGPDTCLLLSRPDRDRRAVERRGASEMERASGTIGTTSPAPSSKPVRSG